MKVKISILNLILILTFIVFTLMFCSSNNANADNSRDEDDKPEAVNADVDGSSDDKETEDVNVNDFTVNSDSIQDGVFENSCGCSNPNDEDYKKPSISITWENAPSDTESFELLFIDLGGKDSFVDEGKNWVHWQVTDIPADTTSLPQGISGTNAMIGTEEENSWGEIGYGGPCPPHPPHTYRIQITAIPSGEKAIIEADFNRDSN